MKRALSKNISQNYAFTLAETLITLVIIGVIAALTVPNLIVKYQKEQTVTKLKKAYSTLSQLVIKSQADHGKVSDFIDSNTIVTADLTKRFFDTFWLPYFTSTKVYDSTPYKQQIPWNFINGKETGTVIYTSYENGRILFSDINGFIYFIVLMHWDNTYDDKGNLVSQIAKYSSEQTIYIDINGINKPNVFGKDVFYFIINFDNNVVRPSGYNSSYEYIQSNCSKTNSTGGAYCAAKIMRDGWKIADDYPW